MSEKEIVVTIAPTGETRVEAKGFRGRGCLEETRGLESALGTVTERRMKPEFRQEETVESRNKARR